MEIATGLPQRARACTRSTIGEFAGGFSDRGRKQLMRRNQYPTVAGNGLSAGWEIEGRNADYFP
jgi:hypothetical protein